MRRARAASEVESVGSDTRRVVGLEEVGSIIPPLDTEVEAGRSAARLPPLRVARILPVAVWSFRAPKIGGLGMRIMRRHDTKKRGDHTYNRAMTQRCGAAEVAYGKERQKREFHVGCLVGVNVFQKVGSRLRP